MKLYGILDLLREIEDRNIKLGGCLERGDIGQAQIHRAEIRSLVLQAAVVALRAEGVAAS